MGAPSKFIPAILAAALSLASAHAGCAFMLLPPPEYDHPFAGRLIVETLPYFDVSPACAFMPLKNGTRDEACARLFADPLNPGKLACKIIYPRLQDVGVECFVNLIRHETGHCNGWGSDHANAIIGN